MVALLQSCLRSNKAMGFRFAATCTAMHDGVANPVMHIQDR